MFTSSKLQYKNPVNWIDVFLTTQNFVVEIDRLLLQGMNYLGILFWLQSSDKILIHIEI